MESTVHPPKACGKCGATNWRKNGQCGSCINTRARANAKALAEAKNAAGTPCPHCGAVDWGASGCKNCAMIRARAYRAARRTPRYCCDCGKVEMAGAQQRCPDCAAQHQTRRLAKLLTTPCADCGATDRFPSGKCRPCESVYKREWAKRQAARTTPCRTCGGVDFTPSGRCRPCAKAKKAKQALTAQTRPCRNCGELDRTPSGACRPCSRERDHSRQRALGAANARCNVCGERNRTPSGRCRTCQTASLLARTHCGLCGGTDFNPSGSCRACALRYRLDRTECPDCGNHDLTKTGQCRPCTKAARMARTNCPACGGTELTAGGECRPCKQALARSRVGTPCAHCGANDRNPSGACRPCAAKKAREHYLANREAYYAKDAKRRALKAQAGGDYTAADIRDLKKSQKGRCWWCGEKLGKTRSEWHVDHVIPLSGGGSNDPANLRIACAPCNLSKGAKTPWEFAGRLF